MTRCIQNVRFLLKDAFPFFIVKKDYTLWLHEFTQTV